MHIVDSPKKEQNEKKAKYLEIGFINNHLNNSDINLNLNLPYMGYLFRKINLRRKKNFHKMFFNNKINPKLFNGGEY